MSTKNTASEPATAPMGLGRKPHETVRQRRAARVRSGMLCGLLGLTLVLAGNPELISETLRLGKHEDDVGMPLIPVDMLLRAVEASESAGNLEESARLCELLCAQHPGHPASEKALLQRTRALATLKRLDEAQEGLDELRVRYPSNPAIPELLLELANEHHERGNFDLAARSYSDLIGRVTRGERVELPAFGKDSSRSARERQALQKKRKLERQAKLERLARFNLAVCYEDNGMLTQALRAYERFIRRFPTDERTSEVNFRMGVLQLGMGRLEQASEHFHFACNAENAPARFRSASIYYAGMCDEKLRRLEEAKDTYRLALDIEPSDEPYRVASLAKLARMIQKREPLHALDLYRDLATHSAHAVPRAIAHESLMAIQDETAIAATSP